MDETLETKLRRASDFATEQSQETLAAILSNCADEARVLDEKHTAQLANRADEVRVLEERCAAQMQLIAMYKAQLTPIGGSQT